MLSQTQKSATNVNDDRQKIDKLREKISEYIKCKEKKRINNLKTIRLRRRVYDACQRENAIIIDVTFALQSLLKIMNKRLNRIEEKNISKINKNSSQTTTMIVERTSSAFWAQVARISKIILKEAFRKNRRAKELMIKIIDDNDKKKLERIIIKNLAKTFRVKCDVVTSINRL